MDGNCTHECAAKIMNTMHLVMKTIGPEIDKRASVVISLQQFRTLFSIRIAEKTSLSHVAQHMGATISSASKIVDALVERGLVTRETDDNDRRKLVLTLTEEGNKIFDSVAITALTVVSEKLKMLSVSECEMINIAMNMIHSAFISTRK